MLIKKMQCDYFAWPGGAGMAPMRVFGCRFCFSRWPEQLLETLAAGNADT